VDLTPEAQAVYRLQRYGAGETIDAVEIVDLQRFNDDGGSMIELMRIADASIPGLDGFRLAQVNFSGLHPGVIKAFHVHRRQTDVWFVPPEDRVLVVLVDVRAESKTEGRRMRVMLGDGRPALLRIPPGVAHGCRNLGENAARLIYFTDLHFSADPDRSDEGRLPWDFIGRDVWDVAWE
jgi:dTDP-4-dehydrorhamnose 3,5-epimerase